jgi:acylphosphatase
MIARKLVVKGKVQGVNFRHYTRQEAVRLGLSGTVRNLANGDVEVWVEGDEAAVNGLVEWCGRGPMLARVNSVSISEVEPAGYSVFTIAR